MALSRRTGQRFQAAIWPGFVDAMTGLLLVLMFVLTIFMVVQFVLRETITGQENELSTLNEEIAAIADALGLERNRVKTLEADLGTLNATLVDTEQELQAQSLLVQQLTSERDAQAAQIEQAQVQIASFEAQVASLLAAQQTDRATISELEGTRDALLSEQEAFNLALAAARSEIDEAAENARRAAAEREAFEALVARLEQDKTTLTQDLSKATENLTQEEAAKAVAQAAAEELRKRLENADAELTAMTLALEQERKKAEDTLTLLAAVQGREKALEEQLQTTLLALEAVELEASDKTSELELLTEQSQATVADLEAAKVALAAALARQQTLERELAASEAELTTASQENAAVKDDLQRVQLELAQAIAAGEEKGADLDALRAEIEAIQSEGRSGLEGLEAQLAAALAAKLTLEQENADVLKQLQDAVAARLAADALAQTRLDESVERDILLQQAKQELAEASVVTAAQAEDIQKAERQTALLNQQVTELRKQLQQLQLVLEQSEEKDRDAQVQLTNMGNRLNAALARAATEERKRRLLEEAERKRLEEERNKLASRAEDLARYKSDFFGALRDIVEGQEGVRIVGDRFVFSSEVLFDAGAAELSDAGRGEIAKVADILRAIMKDIPEGIDWVIRVDGHTDDRPLSGLGEFSDNWELSQARALSVVKFMISDLGVPADRLAANGFGEFQPVNPAQTREARAQNRRIELKLTER